MKIIHVIIGLESGGAEATLYKILTKNKKKISHMVISMTGPGFYGKKIESNGVIVKYLNMKSPISIFLGLFKMGKIFLNEKPDIVQTWLHQADFIAGLIAKIVGVKKIVWNIRTTAVNWGNYSFLTILFARLCGYFCQNIPKIIITCAKQAKKNHLNIGYPNKFCLIHNGVDTEKFSINLSNRIKFRKENNISQDTFLIGLVARFHPVKNHLSFLKTIKEILVTNKDIKCVLIGKNINYQNKQLKNLIEHSKINEKIILIEETSDINKVMNGLDINVLPSLYGETCPNALIEAMSSGTPCVASNLGEIKEIINKFGWTVDPGNSLQLKESILDAINLKSQNNKEWESLCINCSTHIKNNFSINKMIKSYEFLWLNRV